MSSRKRTRPECDSARKPMAPDILLVPILMFNYFISWSIVLLVFFSTTWTGVHRIRWKSFQYLYFPLAYPPRDRLSNRAVMWFFAGSRCSKAIVAIMIKPLRLFPYVTICSSKLCLLRNLYPKNEEEGLLMYKFVLYFKQLPCFVACKGYPGAEVWKIGRECGLIVWRLLFSRVILTS